MTLRALRNLTFLVSALTSAVLIAAPLPAHADTGTAPEEFRAVRVSVQAGDLVKKKITVAQYLSEAAKRGTVLTPDDRSKLEAAGVLGGCWQYAPSVTYYSAVNVRLFAYFHEVTWCGDDTTITWTSGPRVWGEVYTAGWSYQGLISEWGSGPGFTWFRGTQGKFCFVSFFNCIQERYPWIETTAYATGYITFGHGG
jgi:hypothetical protein